MRAGKNIANVYSQTDLHAIIPFLDNYRQKSRLTPCLTITELVCKSNEKTALLPFAISSLVQLLEGADSNTRLVIDESINKIIRVGIDSPK